MTPIPTIATIRRDIEAFDFQRLFSEELGWNSVHPHPRSYSIDNELLTLTPIATKCGVHIFRCGPTADGAIPNARSRVRLSRELTNDVAEHLLVFVDAAQQDQLWLWVRREQGASRPRHFTNREDIAARLRSLHITLEEEADLNVVGVVSKFKKAFDVEAITKKFFELFKKKHDAFVESIDGIAEKADREWYGSLMLNRLMFLYFIQRKNFLDDHPQYLRDRFERLQAKYPPDAQTFYAFYRQFLLRLFHEGLNQRQRSEELTLLIGTVPYLNGGLFDLHELEQHNPAIAIPDHAFVAIFDFFDQYQWQLDDREGKIDDEINPDVLGYIFEKYINRKEKGDKGAYYTKEDITDYIGKNTIIPFIFDQAARDYPAGFTAESPIWQLLRNNPTRYIYPSVLHGVDRDLPADIEVGVHTISKRDTWNRPADRDYGLPTETWREHVARRQRCIALQAELEAGHVTSINDLITLNVNIRQFAADVIGYVADPSSLDALFAAIRSVTVLDPTCGSGAFLFAALNILEPLYSGCLERIQTFVDDQVSDIPPALLAVLAESKNHQHHPSQQYFVLKQIMLKNLYGVDIMDEAVEICKLRLFLKLVAHVDRDATKFNQGLEPLPDIDFNIRTGNTLVGFAREAEVRELFQRKLDLFNMSATIHASAEQTSAAYHSFREHQSRYDVDGATLAHEKAILRQHLMHLNQQLDHYLAQEYGVMPTDRSAFGNWRKSHKPFHWFVEFYEIIEGRGGFDVIIGNPPYVEYSKVKKEYAIRGYQTESCGNLYAFTMERSINLLNPFAKQGLIIPVSIICTQRMKILQDLIFEKSNFTWNSNYAERPDKLFDGAEVLLTISILSIGEGGLNFITGLQKWRSEFRKFLFDSINYQLYDNRLRDFSIPKKISSIDENIIDKIWRNNNIGFYFKKLTENKIYYRIGGGRYWKIFTNFKPMFMIDQTMSTSSRENYLYFENTLYRDIAISTFSSSLFFWYFTLTTNGRDMNPLDLQDFPLSINTMSEDNAYNLSLLSYRLMDDYKNNKQEKQKNSKLTGNVTFEEFYPRLSKPIIDEIDRVLAQHYGFTEEELDYIINYDIKYRMGKDTSDDE